MALIGTVMFSDLMTWGSWKKKEYIKDIPDPKQVNSSYNKIKKQLENMSKSIESYIVGTVINYGEEGYSDDYILNVDIKIKDEDDKIDKLIVDRNRKLLISVYGHWVMINLFDFDIDTQIKIMNVVEEHVSTLDKKTRTNYKFQL